MIATINGIQAHANLPSLLVSSDCTAADRREASDRATQRARAACVPAILRQSSSEKGRTAAGLVTN